MNPEATLNSSSLAQNPARRQSIAALRAHQWSHFLLLPLASLTLEGFEGFEASALRMAASVALAAAVLSWSYGLNSLSDRWMDTQGRKNVLAGQQSPGPWVARAVWACLLVALALAWALGTIPLLAAGTSLLAGTLYSWGPRLKRFPIVGSLLNVPIFLPLLAFGVDTAGTELPPTMPLIAFAFAILLLSNQVLHEWEDREEDRRGGVRSTARLLGKRRLRILVLALGGLGAGAFCFPKLPLVVSAGVALSIALTNSLALMIPTSSPRALHRRLGIVAGALVMLLSMHGSFMGLTGGFS